MAQVKGMILTVLVIQVITLILDKAVGIRSGKTDKKGRVVFHQNNIVLALGIMADIFLVIMLVLPYIKSVGGIRDGLWAYYLLLGLVAITSLVTFASYVFERIAISKTHVYCRNIFGREKVFDRKDITNLVICRDKVISYNGDTKLFSYNSMFDNETQITRMLGESGSLIEHQVFKEMEDE